MSTSLKCFRYQPDDDDDDPMGSKHVGEGHHFIKLCLVVSVFTFYIHFVYYIRANIYVRHIVSAGGLTRKRKMNLVKYSIPLVLCK